MRKLLAFFFHHLYHSLAWAYDFVATVVSIGRWQAWGRAVLPYLYGPQVLELGCGPGHLQVELNRRRFQAVGLDESPQMIHQARRNLARNGLPAALLRAYAQFLPFTADSFDSVCATFPSEYIGQRQTLAEVWRVLKPGGRLVVVPSATLAGKNILDGLSNWLFRVTGQSQPLTEPFEARIKVIFTEAGFSVEVRRVEICQSVVLVIVAEKLPSEATANFIPKME